MKQLAPKVRSKRKKVKEQIACILIWFSHYIQSQKSIWQRSPFGPKEPKKRFYETEARRLLSKETCVFVNGGLLKNEGNKRIIV